MSETFSTVFAGVRLLSSVNSQVVAKALMTETFSTLLAGEGTISIGILLWTFRFTH